MNEKEKDYTNFKDFFLGILLFTLVIIVWKYSWIYIDESVHSINPTKNSDEETRAFFGSKFGAIDALFSALAFAGIIFTIFLQRRDLKYQREELKATRKEFQIQNETLKIQRFENTFFNLLNQHHQIVSDIDFRYYKSKEKEKKTYFLSKAQSINSSPAEKEIVEIKGRDVFRFRYNKLKAEILNNPTEFKNIYEIHYEDAQIDFGHYFRNLYRMIKMVDETDFVTNQNLDEFETKYRYVSIIRAQLSDFELAWIFYNCITPNGIEKFKPLVEKYTLFKNLPWKLIAIIEHKDLYSKKAFNK